MIPRIFHFAWFGGEMPGEYRGYLEGWKKLHPGWIVRIWNDRTVPRLRFRKFFDEAQHPAYKAEIVRLEAVLQEGGVWIDSDFECLKPIGPILKNVDAFSAWQYEDVSRPGAVACGIFGAVPRHPFLQELVDKIPEAWKPDRMSLGPWFFTPIAIKHKITIFEKILFYPYDSNEKHRKGEEFPESFAVHHWAGSWVEHHKRTMSRCF